MTKIRPFTLQLKKLLGPISKRKVRKLSPKDALLRLTIFLGKILRFLEMFRLANCLTLPSPLKKCPTEDSFGRDKVCFFCAWKMFMKKKRRTSRATFRAHVLMMEFNSSCHNLLPRGMPLSNARAISYLLQMTAMFWVFSACEKCGTVE